MPFRTDQAYRSGLDEARHLLGNKVKLGTPEGDRLNTLVDDIETYETKHHNLGLPDPIEAIEFIMDQRGLTRADLEPLIGSRGNVSDVMGRHRPLSLNMIRRIAKELAIPADVLIQEYPTRARQPRDLTPAQ